MKKLIAIVLVIASLCLCLAGCGSKGITMEKLQRSGELVIATSPDFPPFEELQAEYEQAFYNPYAAAASDQITEIINPRESRAKIALTLRTLLSKRETRPAKKHGNMPL